MVATGYTTDPRAVTSVEGRTGAVDITPEDVGVQEAVDEALGTTVSDAITAHAGAVDPHADRAFATSAVSTHAGASDPHGDRSFATSAVSTHAGASDPHGDRAFATSAVSTHAAATDPHGDRAFATAAIATASASLVPTSRTITASTGLTGGGDLSANRSLAVAYGSSAGTAAQGNDSRLSDARTPTAHQHSGADITSGTVPIGQLPTGTSGTTVALGNHTHGVAAGGTGVASVTTNSYLKGAGTSALVERTPAQVKTDIGLDAGAWTAPDSYAASMTNSGTPYYDVASRVEPNGIARLRGRIAAGANYTAGATICTLNSSARPAMEVAFPVRVVGVGAANGSLTITTGGLVTYSANITVGAGTAWLLDGITYTLAA